MKAIWVNIGTSIFSRYVEDKLEKELQVEALRLKLDSKNQQIEQRDQRAERLERDLGTVRGELAEKIEQVGSFEWIIRCVDYVDLKFIYELDWMFHFILFKIAYSRISQ